MFVVGDDACEMVDRISSSNCKTLDPLRISHLISEVDKMQRDVHCITFMISKG
jgi:hypothetical protein